MPTTDRRLRIVLLDDNWDSVVALALLLRHDGHDVRTVHTPDQAVTLAEDFLPDVMVLDIWLTTSSGYDTARRIRQTGWGADIMLIAATGWSHENARRQSEEAGFDHHLVKPIDVEELKRLLATVTPRPVAS